MNRNVMTYICAGLFVLVTVCFAARELGCTLRAARSEAEVKSLVPTLTSLVAQYTKAHRETGDWPEPGTVYDDEVLDFISSRADGDTRVDRYETLAYRHIDVTLEPDGSIKAYVVTPENR